ALTHTEPIIHSQPDSTVQTVPSTSQILSQQQQSFTVSSTTRNTNKDDNNHQHPLPVNDH
ncbi:unnamed protein product, partial [Rotaria socialis]